MLLALYKKTFVLPCSVKISFFLLISGIISISCFQIFSLFPNISYIDKDGRLIEPFFLLGGGWLLIATGMIFLVLSGIILFMRILKKKICDQR